jgi:hypothetical protein
MARAAVRKLVQIDSAIALEDLKAPPGEPVGGSKG